MKHHVIFDFDGTLVNTNNIIIDSWQAVYEQYRGVLGDEDEILATFGEPLWDTMRVLFPEIDPAEGVGLYRRYQEENVIGRIDLFPGVAELIREVRASGRTTSLLTSRLKQTTMQYLDMFGIRDQFDVILTADDTDVHKPDPEPALMMLRELDAEPDDAIMLGDTRFDIGCANNAGIDSVLCTWSRPISADDLAAKGYPPKYVISEPDQLLNFI